MSEQRATHRDDGLVRPTLSAFDVSAFVEAAVWDAVHHEDWTPEEVERAIEVLGNLALTFLPALRQRGVINGQVGDRVFLRMSGLDATGAAPTHIQQRIEVVRRERNGGGDE